MSCANDYTMSSTSVQRFQLRAQRSLSVIENNSKLDLHADACVVDDQYLVVYYHNRPLNVYGHDPKAGLKHVHIVNAGVAHDQPKTHQVVIFVINQEIKMKGLNHHLLCPMQCCMNGVLIDV